MPIFAILTFLVAFSIESLGTLVSVIGLSALFGSNPIIISFAIALDAGKLVVVSLLYKYWDKLKTLMKAYALIAAAITMIITSAGAAGYLSGEFQKAMGGAAEGSVRVSALVKEQSKLEERKKQIDRQIENIPEKYTARQRTAAINQFKEEQQQVTKRLTEIDRELPELQARQIGVEAKAGPILAIAKSFDITPEEAVKWVILVIILVFDPLAVFLIIAGNFLYDRHRQEKQEKSNTLVAAPIAAAPIVDTPIVATEVDTRPAVHSEIKEEDTKLPQKLEDEPKPAPPLEETADLKLRDAEPAPDLIDVPTDSVVEQKPVESLADKIASVDVGQHDEQSFPQLESSPRDVIRIQDLKTHTSVARSSLEDEPDLVTKSSLEDVDNVDGAMGGTRQLSREVRKVYEADSAT